MATLRMLEALELYAQGLTPKQVAARSHVSKDSLNSYLKFIRRETGISETRRAVVEYLRKAKREARKKVVILGIDPGLTTGWACLDESGTLLGSGTVPPDQVEETLDEVIRLVHRNKHRIEVVVERGPLNATGDLSRQLRMVVESIQRVLDTYEISASTILPGVWKTSAVGIAPVLEEVQGKVKLTAHERDALKMAKYHLSRRQTA